MHVVNIEIHLRETVKLEASQIRTFKGPLPSLDVTGTKTSAWCQRGLVCTLPSVEWVENVSTDVNATHTSQYS